MTTQHREVWDLIPWVAAGTADAAQTQCVLQHAAACSDCRDELAFHRGLQQAMQAEAGPPPDAGPAWLRLQARIDAAGAAQPQAPPQPQSQRQTQPQPIAPGPVPAAPPAPHAAPAIPARWSRWLAAAVVLQTVGLAALAGMLLERPRAADYQTLSSPAGPPPGRPVASIRLVAAPTVQLGQLRALLARTQLQIVDSSADAALLALAPLPANAASTAEMLARLRAEPGVLLAEPMAALPGARP